MSDISKGAQAFLSTWETGAQWSSALGDQTRIERLPDRKNNVAIVKHGTEIAIYIYIFINLILKVTAKCFFLG